MDEINIVLVKLRLLLNSPQINIYISIIMIIIMVIGILPLYNIYPHFNSQEKIEANPTLYLFETLLPQDTLFYLEKNQKSVQNDEILEDNLYKENNIYILKFIETKDSNRYILVLFIDPNNIIRFVNLPNNENFTENFDINDLQMPEISHEKNIKIRIPSIDNYYIYGEWHLNIYLYNEKKELTTFISKPIIY